MTSEPTRVALPVNPDTKNQTIDTKYWINVLHVVDLCWTQYWLYFSYFMTVLIYNTAAKLKYLTSNQKLNTIAKHLGVQFQNYKNYKKKYRLNFNILNRMENNIILHTTWFEENLIYAICLIPAGRLEVCVFPCMFSVSELEENLQRFIC